MRRLVILAAVVMTVLAGCGGDDKPTTPTPTGPIAVTLNGGIVLPAGCTANPDSLTILTGHAVADAAADGSFALEIYAADQQLAAVRGPGGAPLLLGWVEEGSGTLDTRTTAEVLAWYGVGAWTLPPPAAGTVRQMIHALTTELDELEAAIAVELVAQPRGLTQPSAGARTALDNTVRGLLTQSPLASYMARPARADRPGGDLQPAGTDGIIVEPGAEASGLAVLNQGGINRVTLKNSWRRRAVAFVRQTGWTDTDGGQHATPDAPDSVLDLPAVGGFAGVFGTIASGITGDIAYTPKTAGPLELKLASGARYTDYEVVAGGAGGAGNAAGAAVTDARLAQIRYTALKGVVWDFFLPLLLNVVATQGLMDDSITLPEDDGTDWAGIAAWIKWIGDNYEPIVNYAAQGQIKQALYELWIASSGTGDFQTRLLAMLRGIAERLGAQAGEAGGAVDAVREYLAVVGWIDVVGNYLDLTAVAVQTAAAHSADRWTVRVTKPTAHLTASQNVIAQYDRVDSLRVVVADTGGSLEGWSWAYRWHCSGHSGTLVNPIHPEDSGNDFVTSSAKVSYRADRGSGPELIQVTASMQKGAESVEIASDTLTVRVTGRTVKIAPDSTNCAASGTRALEARVDPPFQAEATVIYAWSGGGSAGTLQTDGGTPAPFESISPIATYHAGVAQGDDVVRVQVIRLLDDNSRVPVGTARAKVQVRTNMIEGVFSVDRAYNENQECMGMTVHVTFPKRDGVTRYWVHGYNFNDFAWYGTGFSDSGPPFSAGWVDLGGSYQLGLAGYSGCDEGTLNWYYLRFAGSIWEVWPMN